MAPSSPTPISSGPSVFPRVKFVWGASKVIAARWRVGLFGFYERTRGFPDSGLAFSVRGVLGWSAGLALAAVLGGAALLAHWFGRQPHNEIGFLDVLTWPARRGHMAMLRGHAWIGQGTDELKARHWSEGLFLLRRGLDVCPDNFDARLTLAQFYFLSGQRPRALALLADGPQHGVPRRAWLEAALDVAAAGEDWQTVRLICERMRPLLGAPAEWGERQWLLARELAALIELERAPEALALAEAEGDAALPAVKFERARALLALGRALEAADFLARWRPAAPADQRPAILRLEAEALRTANRLDEMERALAELRAAGPARPEPLAFAVEQRARANRGAAAALDDYLFRFGSRPADLQLVLQPLAEIPDLALVRHVVAAAAERGYPGRSFRVQLTMALLRHGDYDEFLREVAALEPQFAQADGNGQQWIGWAQRLAAALVSPAAGAQEQLATFMRTRGLGVTAYRLTIAALYRAGRDRTAHEVLTASQTLYAESPALRAASIEIDRALAAIAASTPLVAAAAPARMTLDWPQFLQALDAACAKPDWAEASRLLTSVHVTQPRLEWIATHESELTWRELQVAQARRETPAMKVAAQFFIDGSELRNTRVLEFARKLHARGENEDAVLLVKAVQHRSPDQPAADALLAEWRTQRAE